MHFVFTRWFLNVQNRFSVLVTYVQSRQPQICLKAVQSVLTTADIFITIISILCHTGSIGKYWCNKGYVMLTKGTRKSLLNGLSIM